MEGTTSGPEQPGDEMSMDDRIALAQARLAAGLCPDCGTQVAPADINCPTCRINLAVARWHIEILVKYRPAGPGGPDSAVRRKEA